MNADKLEEVITRLPKWIQAKFAGHLKSIERKGQVMTNFKDFVDFLKERAYVSNHPFFRDVHRDIVATKIKGKSKSVTPRVSVYAMSAANPESFPMRYQPHRLYRCEAFKSKSSALKLKGFKASASALRTV